MDFSRKGITKWAKKTALSILEGGGSKRGGRITAFGKGGNGSSGVIGVRLKGDWAKLQGLLMKWNKADTIALKEISSEVSHYKNNVGEVLEAQLTAASQAIPLLDRWLSIKQLRSIKSLFKIVGVPPRGYFAGILSDDLSAWQSGFNKRQLDFLKYVGKHAGIEGSSSGTVMILPPTPFYMRTDTQHRDMTRVKERIAKKLGLYG